MQTQLFDRETEQYLSDLLAREQTTTSELLKILIRDRWLSMQAETFAPPEPALSEDASAELLKQKTQKQRISEYVRKKCVR